MNDEKMKEFEELLGPLHRLLREQAPNGFRLTISFDLIDLVFTKTKPISIMIDHDNGAVH